MADNKFGNQTEMRNVYLQIIYRSLGVIQSISISLQSGRSIKYSKNPNQTKTTGKNVDLPSFLEIQQILDSINPWRLLYQAIANFSFRGQILNYVDQQYVTLYIYDVTDCQTLSKFHSC